MQNFISSSDLLCWNIVLKGNNAKFMIIDNDGNMKIRPPITAEEHQQPDPEDINIKFLRGLPSSWSGIALILKTKGGLEYISFDDLYKKLKFLEIDTKGYSSSSPILSNSAFVSTVGSSQGNLSYHEPGNGGYGGYTTTLSASPDFSSSKGSSKSKCSVVDDVLYSFFSNHEIDQQLVYEDLDQMNKDEFEDIDWDKQTKESNTEPRSLENFGMIVGTKIKSDADSEGEVASADAVISADVSISAGLAATAAVSPQSKTKFALMGLSTKAKWNNSGKNLYKLIDSFMSVRTKQGLGLDKYIREGELGIDDFVFSIFHTTSNDLEGQPIYNRFALVDNMKAVPPTINRELYAPFNIPDLVESQMVYGKTATDLSENKTNDDSISHSHDSVLFYFSDRSSKPSNNDFQTCDSSQEFSRPNRSDHDSNDSISSVSTPASASSDTIVLIVLDKKIFLVYLHLIKDCDFHEKTFAKRNAEGKGKLGRIPTGKPVNPNRPNLVFAGQQNTVSAGQPYPVSAGQPNPVSAGQPNPVSAGQQNTISAGQPYPVFAGQPVSAGQPNLVSAGQPNPVSAGQQNTVSAGSPNLVYAGQPNPISAVCQQQRGPRSMVDQNPRAGLLLKDGKAKDRGIVDSGCSRSMSGNIDKLEDFEHFDGGEVTFGGSTGKISGKGTIKTKNLNFENVLYVKELQHFNLISVSQICDQTHRVLFTETKCLVISKDFPLPGPSMIILSIPRKHNLYTFNLHELAPQGPLTCLIAKASQNESTLWHRRFSHVNFRNMNKLVKGNLVRGLPSKVFQNNHTCVSCNKGKQYKASYKAIHSISLITEPLYLLHMDLFGPTSVKSINNKYYCLVITDEYTIFSWVYFLEQKSDTFLILKNFITLVENQFNHKVKAIRCDNGTEFKNANLIEFCGSKGIQRDYSNARTPQQNGVAERKNRTLIEVARTMLADSFLPTIFWMEAVATACYVLNRVLVTKPHAKTPYELLTGDKPSISYLKPFGCHVTILNTSESLGKFNKKSYEGYIVGYSISSKAYRVYNLVSRKIEKTMNLIFLENKPFVAGTGQAWMFDIDYLTDSLNYSRVSCNNLTAGSPSEKPANVGSQEDDSDSDDEPNVLIIHSTPTSEVPIVNEASIQHDGTKSDHAPTNEDNLDEFTELQSLQRQEQAAKEEADRLGLAFPSLNPNLGVGSTSIGSSVSAGSTPLIYAASTPPLSPCASPIFTDRHSISAGKSPVPAARPPVSAGRSTFAGRPTDSAGRPVFAGRPSSSAARTPVSAGRILGKVTESASSDRFPRASSVENSDIHDGLTIFDCPKSGIFTSSSYDKDLSGPNANNLQSTFAVSSIITKRIHTIHPTSQVIGDINSPVQTRSQALADPDWVEAMQAEMQQFRNQKNKRDARGIVCKNMARLVAQGHRQEEGIDYTDIFALVARLEAIRLFLAFASFIGFKVYQMDAKSAFLYGKIAEESEFEMSSMRPLTFFLGLQVDQRPDGIFIHQEKEKNVLDSPISVYLYRSMIGCLMYLTATRPDIMFAVCAAARHQVTPKTSYLLSVKRIFKYLTAHPKLGIWYPRDSLFDLEAFSNSDYAGAYGDRKSTTGGCQFLGRRLISWQCKKQTIVATSSCEAEYWLLFTSAGRLIFCWLLVVPAGHISFMRVVSFSCWYMTVTAGSASKVSLPDGVKGLVATINGNAYTVTEASIRSALQLDDHNAIDTLTNAEIFDGLRAIGYATEGKFTFFKNKFSPQWKFLIHTLIHCLSSKIGSWNQFASNIAIALICLSTGRKYNFSNLIFDEVSPPPPSLVVEPHPSNDPMPSPPMQSSPLPIPFGLAPSSGVASTDPIPDIPSSSRPSEPVLETITSPIRDDDTGGRSYPERPPSPSPATPTRSPTVGVAEEPLTLISMLALFPTCLHHSSTPFKPVYPDKSSEQEISPTFLDVVLTLSQSKTRARAAKIIYKRLKKQQSSSGLDFTNVAIPAVGRVSAGDADPAYVVVSAGVSVVAGLSIPSVPSSPIRDPAKGKAIATPSSPVTAPSDKELADQQAAIFKAERQELLEQELKQSLDAEQAKAKRDKPLTPAQQKEYMRAFVKNQSTAYYTTGWTWKDVRGLTDDQLQNVYNKIRRAVDLATAKDHHQQLKRSGETLESSTSKKLKSSLSTEQSTELQDTTSVSTGAIIAAGDPISAVPSISAASSIPVETPIPAGVSTTAGVFESASVPIIDLLDSPPKATSLPLDPATAEHVVPLRKSTRKKSMARRRTLSRPTQSESAALPFDDDDPKAKFKKYLRQVSDDDEPAEPVFLSLVSNIRTWEIIPTEFGLGEIHVITRADGTVKIFSTLRELMHWVGRADLMVLYGMVLDKYKLERATSIETEAGDIMYMFVDKKYPILPATIQRMLNHGLEIDRDPFDLLKVCRALIMSAMVLNCPAFKLEEIVMAMMTCLKSSGVHYQCFTVKCGLLWGGLLGIVIPTASVFCSCCQFFISAGVLFLLLEYSVPAASTSLLLLARGTAIKQIIIVS
uniref:Putative ribonuclease H-like domain-containing protein n=1 Tax=Tanacetum cinerariifolium TaxID=118510 RepID=A0A6L2JK10_TANCI|nr:putative ribonuclease H-like domain-containing protein [Tanacetum cinerariifolium]